MITRPGDGSVITPGWGWVGGAQNRQIIYYVICECSLTFCISGEPNETPLHDYMYTRYMTGSAERVIAFAAVHDIVLIQVIATRSTEGDSIQVAI